MTRTDFGDCIGCGQPIRPPYLIFDVKRLEQERRQSPCICSWGEVDVCTECAAKLTVADLYRLVTADEE